MAKLSFLALVAVSILNLAGTQPALAGDVKFPDKSDPALTFIIPTSWRAKTLASDDPQVFFMDVQSGKNFSLSLTFMELPAGVIAEMKKEVLPALAASAFKSAQFQQTDKVTETEIDGIKSVSFLGVKDTGNGTTATFKLTIVKVDATHVATIGVIAAGTLSTTDTMLLQKVVASMKFTKAPAPAR